MLQKIGKLLGGDPYKREIQRLSETAGRINAMEADFEALSDDALRAKTDAFRRRLAEGETLDDLLPEAFATVREASKRTIGLRHYDVQLIGGTALHSGKIVEMRTGEGKTLVATLPLYLNALTGKGVHLVTVNDYLARRDARWMAPIYNLLGMSVGVLQMSARGEDSRNALMVDLEKISSIEDQHQLKTVPRREAYLADITYGTNAEFGFDYLRDNLTMRLDDRVQRKHHYAIVDEVDNILIDEARTPLIISGPAAEEATEYQRMAQVVRQLNPEDYEINEKDRSATLTEAGEMHVEELLGEALRDPERPEDITPEQARLLGYLEQAMRAQYLYKRNKDYLVQGGKVVIVDEFTGRLMPGRRWSEGLHQAVEAKEGVKVEPENVTYATITLQNYFRMYEKLAGMTGTALTEAEEFFKIYKLDVFPLPTNLEYSASNDNAPLVSLEGKDEQGYKYQYYARRDDSERKPVYWKRKDYPDVVFRTEEAKLRAIIQEIIRFHVMGRPQLVGTTSVENSERLSTRMEAENIRRLAQVLLIRQAWMDKNKIDFIERNVPELAELNTPLNELKPDKLRPMARDLGISLNPEDPANLECLLSILSLTPDASPRLIKVLQGGIPHQVLNARKHTEESQIIAKAGAFGAVTIATNMAGRGVDIKLGGEMSEDILADVIRVLGKNGYAEPYDMTNEARRQALLKLQPEDYGIYEEAVKAFLQYMDDMENVRAVGGLHVIGSERHEARRIDNQLRGRAARQGDPGSSRFYLSLEDDLMRIFGGGSVEGLLKRLNIEENIPIEHNLLGRLVEQSQERVEGANFDVRKHLLEYDDVLNNQRNRIYSQRDRVFTKEDLSDDVMEMLQTDLQERIPEALKDEEGPWKLLAYLAEIQPSIEYDTVSYPSYPYRLLVDELRSKLPESNISVNQLQDVLLGLAERALNAERDHVLHSARTIIEKAEENLVNAREERLDIVDSFFESLGGDEEEGIPPRRPQEILTELSEQVHISFKLSNEQMRRLAEGDRDIKRLIRDQVESHLGYAAVTRLGATLERRLEENLDLRPAQIQGATWKEAADQFYAATEKVFERRMERLLGSGGQVARDLKPALERLGEETLEDKHLIYLLRVMSYGQHLAFDRKTHRQTTVGYNRIKYNFLCAQIMEGMNPKEAATNILEHLTGALSALQHAWGLIEWNRMPQDQPVLERIEGRPKTVLFEKLGEQRFHAMAARPLETFSLAEREEVCRIIGAYIQNENARQLLLRVISDLWVDYLTRIEALRVSIGLEAYAQRDPLVMYKSKASEEFKKLLAEIRMGVIGRMFTYQTRVVMQAAAERQQSTGGQAHPQTTPAAQPTQVTQTQQPAAGGGKRKRHRH